MKDNNIEQNQMHRGERLLDAVGEIKDEYIIEAAEPVENSAAPFTVMEGTVADGGIQSVSNQGEPKDRKHTWIRILSAAAVLILCVGVGRILLKSNTPIYNEEIAPAESHYDSSEEGVSEESSEETSGAMLAGEPKKEAENSTTNDVEIEGVEIEEPSTELVEEPDWIPNPDQGEAFVLTAGQWNDNDNWPFFMNLVNSGRISFPSYGIDPRDRIKVTVLDESGNPLSNEEVYLEGSDSILWKARTNKNGVAYLFVEDGYGPTEIHVSGETVELYVEDTDDDDQQGEPVVIFRDDITVTATPSAETLNGVQVMFIVDTTGSMGDELAYLQMDFSQIAADTADGGTMYSVNFYRDNGDAYVTKTNGFTSDVNAIQELISSEYAAGGGDTPEAVAEILYETITINEEWRSDMNKVCFLIFDAPPHDGFENVIAESVKTAAEKGIHIVPVVASNSERVTELFGRALAICTDGEYVFLTDDSGVGLSHLEPIIGDYDVRLLHDVIVDIINSYK